MARPKLVSVNEVVERGGNTALYNNRDSFNNSNDNSKRSVLSTHNIIIALIVAMIIAHNSEDNSDSLLSSLLSIIY